MSHIVHDQLCRLAKEVQEAATELARDRCASSTLGAVFGDFRDRAMRAEALSRESDDENMHDIVLEMQHVGDVTIKAALADLRLNDDTRALLLRVCDEVHALSAPPSTHGQTAMPRSPKD